ncbi:MAG: hypothetical protein JNL21_34905, partial [Myxococcales bacterium]|nr:hypothetical protein [Myxococcales bacterium]
MKEGVDPFRAVARVIHAVGHPLPRKRAFAREKGPALPKLFWPFGVLVAALVATTNSSEPSTTPAPKPWERSMSFTPVPARRAPVCPSSHPCTSTHIAGYPAERLRAELRAVARHVARRHNTRADLDDLVQIGLLTACALASRFDPARGTTFLTFVYRRAAGAMIDACRRERHLVGPSVDIDACEIGAGSAEDDILE